MNRRSEATPLQKLAYTVSFNTPAFLGNAEQNGQWRTPPFKALLRQWWRVVKAKDFMYDHHKMREAEGVLFGNAWLTDKNKKPLYRKSGLGLRLSSWGEGTLESGQWPGGQIESVATTRDGQGRVRADVYLGYGPVLAPSRTENRNSITIRRAINSILQRDAKPVELQLLPSRNRSLRPSRADIEDVKNAMQLAAWFGCVGSRARNGWGSLELKPSSGQMKLTDTTIQSAVLHEELKPSSEQIKLTNLPSIEHPLLQAVCREWTTCLELDWAHAIGTSDGKPLVWTTQAFEHWRGTMGRLAHIKISVRSVAKRMTGPAGIGGIHLLGYPAGGAWELPELNKRQGGEARLPSQLRFKVLHTEKGYVGLVFHVPHKFPEALSNDLTKEQQRWLKDEQADVWSRVHAELSRDARLTRLGAMR